MKRTARVLALAVFALPTVGALRPAEAGVAWVAGANFAVGGVFFSLGFSGPQHYGRSYSPTYYYRTRENLSYRGYECGSACYVRGGERHHGRSCPVVRQHFRRHGFDPGYVWGDVAFGARRDYGRSHRHAPRYYGADRWDRRSRGYRRHNSHRHNGHRHNSHRDRRHRHHRGCRH